jgi:predicted O-methyltransferase YrrM
LEAQDNFPNLVYHQGWSTPALAEINRGQHLRGDVDSAYQQIADALEFYNRKIDILFIDSWHCYEYAKMDYEAYSPLLSSPALIICDDIQAGGGPESPIQGMMDFWDELPEPKFLNANLHPGTNLGFVKV